MSSPNIQPKELKPSAKEGDTGLISGILLKDYTYMYIYIVTYKSSICVDYMRGNIRGPV